MATSFFNGPFFAGEFFSASVAPPTINYQGDGKTRRKRRRNKTYELFDALEHTIRQAVTGDVAPAPALHAVATPAVDLSHGYDAALDQLLATAGAYEDLSLRVVTLRADLQAYEADQRQRRIMEDEEEWLMMS